MVDLAAAFGGHPRPAIPVRLGEARPDRRQRLGARGEAAATRFLDRRGMSIIETRFRMRCGEIDLIGEIGGLVVFVEVKTRSGPGYGRPAEAVTAVKRQRMARAALAFLKGRGWLDRPCRFDVVEVMDRGGRVARVRHIPDAFRLWPTG